MWCLTLPQKSHRRIRLNIPQLFSITLSIEPANEPAISSANLIRVLPLPMRVQERQCTLERKAEFVLNHQHAYQQSWQLQLFEQFPQLARQLHDNLLSYKYFDLQSVYK